ncbi:MAG: cell division protein FtsQ/DivIB, partial [Actinomycetota bacterium]
GERRMIDRDGVVLPEEERGQLPVVVLDQAPPAVGGEVDDDPALDNAFRAWRGLSGPIRSEVVRYMAAGEDELELELDNGVTVRFGRASRVDEKVRALGAVLADVGDTPIEAVDVRAPGAPVVVGP